MSEARLEKSIKQLGVAGLESVKHAVHIEHVWSGLRWKRDHIVVGLILVESEDHPPHPMNAAKRQSVHVIPRRRIGDYDVGSARNERFTTHPKHDLIPALG